MRNGGFTGAISLLDPEGEVKAEKLTGVIDPNGFVNETQDSWEQEHERLYIYIPEKAEAGDSISINGGEECNKDLILPLSSETQIEVDYSTRNDYIQLGIKLDEERLAIKGDEDQEGLIDFDDQKIVLEGTFQDGDLIGFHWHETLPDGLDSYKPYQISI